MPLSGEAPAQLLRVATKLVAKLELAPGNFEPVRRLAASESYESQLHARPADAFRLRRKHRLMHLGRNCSQRVIATSDYDRSRPGRTIDRDAPVTSIATTCCWRSRPSCGLVCDGRRWVIWEPALRRAEEGPS